MSFFDKLKVGVSEAGNKAKVLVEINKLRLLNTGKTNEINTLYQEIGKMVVTSVEQDESLEKENYLLLIEQISILKYEIEQNKMKISNLSDQKECPKCQKMNPIDSRYCMKCGHAYRIYEVNDQPVQFIEYPKDDESK